MSGGDTMNGMAMGGSMANMDHSQRQGGSGMAGMDHGQMGGMDMKNMSMRDPKNAPVVQFALSFLVMAAIFQLADGAQAVGAGMLRGLQDTRVPMIYAAFGYWGVGLPLGVALAFGTSLRGVGIWIGLATGLGVVAALMLWRWSRRERLGLLPA